MRNKETEIKKCEALANAIRQDVLRMTYEKKAGFIGTSFSCAEILAVIFGSFMKFDVQNPENDSNDAFILSKGHGASALYAVLAEIGAFARDRLFAEFNTSGFNMGVHPKRGSLPGVISSGGSLGQGLGLACGLALSAGMKGGAKKIFVLLGDGECNEGAVWESFMLANRFNLDNILAVVDRNKLQSYGHDHEVLNMGDMEAKIKSFGWNAATVNGHDCGELYDAISSLLTRRGKPSAIIANTIKGKGVSAFEDKVLWHYKWPESEHMETALKELGERHA
jgi:transketolase